MAGTRPRRLLRVKWAPVVWPSSCQHFTVQLRVFPICTQTPKSEESGLGGLQCHSGYGAQGSDRLVSPDSSEKPLRLLHVSSIASCCTSQLSLAFEHPKVRTDSTLTPPARPCLSNIYKPNDRLGRRHSDPNCSTGCWHCTCILTLGWSSAINAVCPLLQASHLSFTNL